MKFKRLAVASTIAASACVPVFAEEGANKVYVDAGFTQIFVKFEGARFTPTALRLVGGYELLPHLAAEAMVVVGLTESTSLVTKDNALYKVSVKPGTTFGVFLKPKADFGESGEHEVYGRVGYLDASSQTTGAIGATSLSSSGSIGNGLSYGFGAKMNMEKDLYLSADYMRYAKGDGVVIDGVTVGFTKHFK